MLIKVLLISLILLLFSPQDLGQGAEGSGAVRCVLVPRLEAAALLTGVRGSARVRQHGGIHCESIRVHSCTGSAKYSTARRTAKATLYVHANQQCNLNKLLTELRCRNFVNKPRLSVQVGAKRAKTCMQCVYIRTEFPFCTAQLLVGYLITPPPTHTHKSFCFIHKKVLFSCTMFCTSLVTGNPIFGKNSSCS